MVWYGKEGKYKGTKLKLVNKQKRERKRERRGRKEKVFFIF